MSLAKNDDPKTYHFFASSIAEWKVDTDVRELTKFMDKEPHPYNLWYVPVALEDDYQIKYYTPQVEGIVFLGQYETAKSKKGVKA